MFPMGENNKNVKLLPIKRQKNNMFCIRMLFVGTRIGTVRHQVSISSKFFEQLLLLQILKAQRRQSQDSSAVLRF